MILKSEDPDQILIPTIDRNSRNPCCRETWAGIAIPAVDLLPLLARPLSCLVDEMGWGCKRERTAWMMV